MLLEDIPGFPKKLPKEFHQNFAVFYNKIVSLKEEVNYLRRQLYGRKSERYSKTDYIDLQGRLFDDAEAIAEYEKMMKEKEKEKGEDETTKNKNSSSKPRKKRQPDQKLYPKDTPREIVVHDLPENEKICPYDHNPLKEISTDVVEKLDFQPAQFKVIEHHYKKYSCPHCNHYLLKAKAEPSILPSSIAEPALFAHVVANKFLNHLPLYRQEFIFSQKKIFLSRATLAYWILAAAESIKPLLEELRKYILNQKVIHADETTIQVLKSRHKISPSSKSYMWVMASGIDAFPAVYFRYFPSRSKESAYELLKDFKDGVLQVDGYDSYNILCINPSVTRAGCFAHVRRKFYDAQVKGAGKDSTLAEVFLQKIQKLFLLEREWEKLTPENRLQERKIHSQPIINEIRALASENIFKIPLQSKLNRAIKYMLNEWTYLTKFLKNGSISLSNNHAENCIRPFVLGRKNWLFANSEKGAQASGDLYSLVVTAMKNELHVEKYLTYLFTILPKIKKQTDFDYTTLLPWNLKTAFHAPKKDSS